jgi:UDP-glucose 4-epimerase
MNILITGAAGLIGSRLAEHLSSKENVTIVGVDDLSGGFIENIPSSITFHQLNVDDVDRMEFLFREYEFDIVYHLAAYAAECVSPFIRRFNYSNNLVSTANIVNLCIKYDVKRLVFTSTMAVYGSNTPPFHEKMFRNPVDPYGVAKAACEQDIEIAATQHGLDYCIIRPHNVYGRNQNIWDSYRNVIGIWMYKSLVGDPITIFGDGLQKRAFSYIDDILEPLWQAGISKAASKQIINLGGIEEHTIEETARIVCEVTGNTELIHLPPRHEVKHAFATYQKSTELLGFEHKTELKEGVQLMWEWAKIQPKRERFIWTEYEIQHGLYPYWQPAALKDGYWKK